MAAPHRTHDGSHPKCRADRPPGNGSCPHRESPQKRALDGEDQLYTTGSAPRFTVNVVGSTWWTVRAAVATNSRSRSARSSGGATNTLSEPCSHLLNRATRTHAKRARRDNLQRSAQITARSKQGTRTRGHHTRHTGSGEQFPMGMEVMRPRGTTTDL